MTEARKKEDMRPLLDSEITALEDRYLQNVIHEVTQPPGTVDIDSDEYAEIYGNLCDAVIQLLWPTAFHTDPDDEEFHTSAEARRIANVLIVAAGYRRND